MPCTIRDITFVQKTLIFSGGINLPTCRCVCQMPRTLKLYQRRNRAEGNEGTAEKENEECIPPSCFHATYEILNKSLAWTAVRSHGTTTSRRCISSLPFVVRHGFGLAYTWRQIVSCRREKVVVSCVVPTRGFVSSGGPTASLETVVLQLLAKAV